MTDIDPAHATVEQLPGLLVGTTWTVFVDAELAAQRCVRTVPDLEVLAWWLIEDGVDLVDDAGTVRGQLIGDAVWVDGEEVEIVRGPGGWLEALSGGWATVAVTGGGLRWTHCAQPPEPTERQVSAVREGFARAVIQERLDFADNPPDDLRFVTGSGWIEQALIADREAFLDAQSPPLAVLLGAADLEQRDGITVERGQFEWDRLRRWQGAQQLALRFGVESADADVVLDALDACGDLADEALVDADARRFALVLDDGAAAAAFWDGAYDRGITPGEIAEFAAAVDAQCPGASRFGTGWLRSRGIDAAGDPLAAVALVDSLVTADCVHGPLLLDAAAFAADRGDAIAAHRLLRQAGVPDRPDSVEGASMDDDPPMDDAALLMDEVLDWATRRPRAMAGRNDPCPCGSGRKYKACHLGRETFALTERAGWLYDKATRYHDARYGFVAAEIAAVLAGADDELFDELLDLPLAADLAMAEGGVFATFLEARRALLPEDEAELADQWATVRRGVFDVLDIDRDVLVLHDRVADCTITVANVQPSALTGVGSVLVGRPLPVGSDHRAFSGFLPILPEMADDVIAAIRHGSAADVAAAIAPMFAAADAADQELPIRS